MIFFQIQINRRLFSLFLILFTILTKSYGQFKFIGTHCVHYDLKDFSSCYTFTDNGEFEYKHSGHLGVQKYGKGKFKIKDSILTLNYNKTKVKYSSYHKTASWESDIDSITLKFKVLDINGERIKYASIIVDLKNKIGLKTDSSGIANIKIKKSALKNKIRIGHIGYGKHIFEVKFNKSYDFEVYLDGVNNPKLIKDRIFKYQIIEKEGDYSIMKNDGGKKTLWKKLK